METVAKVNSLKSVQPKLAPLLYVSVKGCTLEAQLGGVYPPTVTSNIRSDCAYLEVGNIGNSRLIRRVGIVVSTQRAWAAIIAIIAGLTIALSLKIYAGVALPWVLNQAGTHQRS